MKHKDECVFCKIAKGEIKCDFIYENDNFFSIYDANPKVDGHSLVISKKHFNTMLDLPTSLGEELIDCIKKTTLKLMKQFKSAGFQIEQNNFKAGEQVVKHFHLHILPRKEDDNLKLRLIRYTDDKISVIDR